MNNLSKGICIGFIIGLIAGQFYVIHRIFGNFMLHSSFSELQNICLIK